MIKQLEEKPIPIKLEYNDQEYKGEAVPVKSSCHDGVCFLLEITLNDEYKGIIRRLRRGGKWTVKLIRN